MVRLHGESIQEWINLLLQDRIWRDFFCFILQNGCLLCTDNLSQQLQSRDLTHAHNQILLDWE